MTELDKTVAEFRDKLHDQGATFLLVYAVKNVITDTFDTRITSNSNQFGIRTILAAILRPTEHAIGLVAKALEDSARAAVSVLPQAIDAAVGDGAFSRAAMALFAEIRPHLTIAGWEKESPGKPQQSC
jgi:hypothetical protein